MSDFRLDQALKLAERRDEPGCREQALSLLETLVADGQGGAKARFLLASLHDDRPEGMEKAVEHYRAGLALDPADPAARNNLAVALVALGKVQEAVDELVAVALSDPGYALATQNLAQLSLEHLSDEQLAGAMSRLSAGGEGKGLLGLARAMAEAGRQDALQSTYTAGHALKNLVGLAGSKAAQLARKGDAASRELAQSLEKIYGEWSAFLKSARASAQRPRPCDLNALAAEVARGFPLAEQPRVNPGAAPALALGDPAALREAILNLARNAREASPQGSVEIAASAEPGGRWVRLSVRDDGAGISPANLRRIFAPGFTTKPQGSGFGLSIAERIAQSCGGHIEVDSQPGKGSCFSLVLPAAADTPPRLAPRLHPEEFTR